MRAFSLEVLANKTATQAPVMMRAQPPSPRNAPISTAKGTSVESYK